MSDQSSSTALHAALLSDIKTRVRHAQSRAWLSVNAEMIRLYWDVGALIDSRQRQEGWGAAVIPRLARDLHNELPEEKGFSERNIKRMLAFYREYPDLAFVPQPVAQIGPKEKGPQPVAPAATTEKTALFPAELLPTEYALRGMDKPIGVSSFELTRALPETLQTSLPSIEAIERELGELPEEPSE